MFHIHGKSPTFQIIDYIDSPQFRVSPLNGVLVPTNRFAHCSLNSPLYLSVCKQFGFLILETEFYRRVKMHSTSTAKRGFAFIFRFMVVETFTEKKMYAYRGKVPNLLSPPRPS